MPVDTTKLVKIMNMLDSSFENERLTAITLAQKMVKESGQSWEQLLNGKASSPYTMQMLNAGQARMHQEMGFKRGFQAGLAQGRNDVALNLRRQIEEAYKRGVKETMDKARDPAQVKHLMEQAYEKGRAFERAQHETIKKGKRIKWDEFAVNALDGQYGSISSWYKQFLLNIVNFPKVSAKQLIVLQRLSDDLDTNLTILA